MVYTLPVLETVKLGMNSLKNVHMMSGYEFLCGIHFSRFNSAHMGVHYLIMCYM